MTRALSTEEPCAINVARTVLKASGGGDPVAEPNRVPAMQRLFTMAFFGLAVDVGATIVV